MSERNGSKTLWIVFWIFAVIIFPTLFFIGNSVIANDKESRARDDKIMECLHNFILPMRDDLTAIKTKLGIEEKYRKEASYTYDGK